MKKDITIVGMIDEEEETIKLSKHGLSVPHLVMVITELTKMLFNEADEEDAEALKEILGDIAEDPEKELKKQFEAIRLSRLLKGLKDLGFIVEEDKSKKIN